MQDRDVGLIPGPQPDLASTQHRMLLPGRPLITTRRRRALPARRVARGQPRRQAGQHAVVAIPIVPPEPALDRNGVATTTMPRKVTSHSGHARRIRR